MEPLNVKPMSVLRLTPAITLTLTLAACATTSDFSTASDASAVNCARVLPIGSNIPVRRCQTAEEMRLEAEAARATAGAVENARNGIRGPAGQ